MVHRVDVVLSAHYGEDEKNITKQLNSGHVDKIHGHYLIDE